MKDSMVFPVLVIILGVATHLIQGGIITNESISVSSSSSSSVSSSKQGNQSQPSSSVLMNMEAKKPSKVGKVLYTAPYSHVRISDPKMPVPKLPKKYHKSLEGPVLKKGVIPVQTTPTTTSTSTTSVPTTVLSTDEPGVSMPMIALLEIVTEPEGSASLEEGSSSNNDNVTTDATTAIVSEDL